MARCSSSRRQAKGASASRSPAAFSSEARRRRAVRRDGRLRPFAASTTRGSSSTRSSGRGVPAWFDRGTRRPHPAGRAFLALLACAAEGLSASRFAEYLSLGQLPEPGQPTAGVDRVRRRSVRRARHPGSETSRRSDAGAAGRRRVAGTTDRRDAGRNPAHAAALGADARRGRGDRRRSRRAGRGASHGLAEELRARLERGETRRSGSRRALAAIDDDRRRLESPPVVCAAAHHRDGGVAGAGATGATGSIGSITSRRGRCARRRTCCACSPTCGRWRPSGRCRCNEVRMVLMRAAAQRGQRAAVAAATAACSSAARRRRAAARSASCSCPAWPSGCSREVGRRIRCCSTSRASG